MPELKATVREELGKKVNKGRKNGNIPAVVYGRGLKAQALFVADRDFGKVYKEAGESTLVGLEIGGKKHNVLIHDVQKDPLSSAFTHIDFYEVRMDEKIKATVPVVFIGESEAVKAHGGVLVKIIQEVEVEALPQDLPRQIEVNISCLSTFEDRISIRDLAIAGSAKIMADLDEIVASVTPPRSEEELAALEGKVEVSAEEVKVVGEEEKAAKAAEAAEAKDTK